MKLATTPEERVNAKEVLPWIAADREEWSLARSELEAVYETEVKSALRLFAGDVKKQREAGWLGADPLMTPVQLTLLNAAQVAWDLGVSIVKGAQVPTAAELRRVRRLATLAKSVYDVTETRPFAVTEGVRTSHMEFAKVLGEPEYMGLALGRTLSARTVNTLALADRLALQRLRDAKS